MRSVFLIAFSILAVTAALRGGELVTETIDSKAVNRSLKVNVLLPDGYARGAARRFPVIYLLHGYGGDFSEWQRVGVVEEAKGLPVIIAMPEGDQSFYINFHGDPEARWEDWITEEVISFIDSKYRTIPEREHRGVSGLSMGGYGAVTLGLRHPELFASVASHSGAVGVLRGPLRGGIAERINRIFGPEDSEERKKYDPVRLIEGLAAEDRPHIYLDCGSGDFLLGQNREFVRELSDRGVAYEYREVPGRHDFQYWKANVRYSLTRQLEALEKAAANPWPRAGDPHLIAGMWKARAGLPNGGEGDSVLHIEAKDGKLRGRVEWNDGEREAELDRVTFSGKKFRVEIDYERDGNKGVVFVEASLVSPGKLVGKWGGRRDDGGEVFSRDWQAVLDTPAQEREKVKEKRPGSAALVGNWDVILSFQGNEIDYTFRFEKKGDGRLEAVQVSPRSGEHRFKSAELKDGALRMVITREYDQGPMTFIYEGKLSKSGLAGRVYVKDFGDEAVGEWKATKAARKAQL